MTELTTSDTIRTNVHIVTTRTAKHGRGDRMEEEKREVIELIKKLTAEELAEFVRRLPELLGENKE